LTKGVVAGSLSPGAEVEEEEEEEEATSPQSEEPQASGATQGDCCQAKVRTLT